LQNCGRSHRLHQHETTDGLTGGLRPDAEETRQFGLRSAVPRPDRTRTAVNPERNLPVLRKIAIIRLKFRVHPGNPGYTETPLYT
jgi:hypothetical protein